MRKFKTRKPRSLPIRLLVILAGALLLLAAFAPCANADLLRFYDFEGPDSPPYPFGLHSNPPALEVGPQFDASLLTNIGTPYPALATSQQVGIPLNGFPSPPALPNNTSFGNHNSGFVNLNIVMPFNSFGGVYDIQSVSFASASSGNGFQMVQLQMSVDDGANWTNLSVLTPIPTAITVITLNNTLGVTLGNPSLLVRLHFQNGQSNGGNLQNVIDNIQVNGVAVPEPATVAGGLFGVLGLCWQQRRRLIGALRLRRT